MSQTFSYGHMEKFGASSFNERQQAGILHPQRGQSIISNKQYQHKKGMSSVGIPPTCPGGGVPSLSALFVPPATAVDATTHGRDNQKSLMKASKSSEFSHPKRVSMFDETRADPSVLATPEVYSSSLEPIKIGRKGSRSVMDFHTQGSMERELMVSGRQQHSVSPSHSTFRRLGSTPKGGHSPHSSKLAAAFDPMFRSGLKMSPGRSVAGFMPNGAVILNRPNSTSYPLPPHPANILEPARQYYLNPCNPSKNSAKGGSQSRRWEHINPKYIMPSLRFDESSMNWKSLCTPACLPLTTEFFPTPEELSELYQEYTYTVSPADDANPYQDATRGVAGALDTAESNASSESRMVESLLMELISQRLAQGFQLVVSTIQDGSQKVPGTPPVGGTSTVDMIMPDGKCSRHGFFSTFISSFITH
jgi:hypothetical protein